MRYRIDLPDPEATLAWGRSLGTRLWPGAIIYLSGTLGAGKTSLCRGVLAALGHAGPVKSPTYTLVEPYTLTYGNVYHFDLYRLVDPEELEWIGGRDYFDGESICLIEWPERGAGALPAPDLTLSLELAGSGRTLWITAGSARARALLVDLPTTPRSP
ncbi:MAG: tRNA (adenosine(37)-N6)-threonylcarbamoyltransferase complex ATPase subunit type 1 TsaE [Porticoccaceae bacterium]|nr:MAG: tRNA (adenosine(37)-N6)-threonylcarbamoyltransferase complex ATPase subunit type 1 TsaE [Porticoccaceae bacterium]